MIVPEYWAEARQQVRLKGRQVTVRRFGWSDDSPQAAQAHAEQRTQEALDAILAGRDDVPRRELRSNYGTHGVPIREQIVECHDDVSVTRNSYGALYLNTPDVLFADMEFRAEAVGLGLAVRSKCRGFAGRFRRGSGSGRCGNVGFATAMGVLVLTNRLALMLKRRRFDRVGFVFPDGGCERGGPNTSRSSCPIQVPGA